ncbi:MAG: hypothetical protein U5R49_15295 [Deltaproteobacteria bacterium]|nr:hypothetical protein [Deltaproteobacteria bacterium]
MKTPQVQPIFRKIHGGLKRILSWMCASDIHLMVTSVAFCILSLCLHWESSIFPLGGPHDSLRYIGMAETILKGEWLGEYSHMTLIRSPVYSSILAVNSLIGWRLHVFQQCIFLVSILLLTAALRSLHVERWKILIICFLCVFHPLTIYCTNFVVSEAVYVSFATAVMAGCFGILGTYKGSFIRYSFWVVILSVASALFWHIRPESVWILPFFAICFGYLLRFAKTTSGAIWFRVSAAVFAPLFAVLFFGHQLAALNEKHYGIRVTHELAEPNFISAFNWLTRVAPSSIRPHVPVSRDAVEAAYTVSEHFALLEPYLSQQKDGHGWTRFGCEWMGICHELAGGWAVWAIRDAAASIGVYTDAARASQFYGSVAREIRHACEEGKVKCTQNPTGNFLAPPMGLADIPRILMSSLKVLFMTVTLGDFALDPQELDRSNPIISERYEVITHDQKGQWPEYYGETAEIHADIYRIIQLAGGAIFLMMLTVVLFVRSKAHHLGSLFHFRQLVVCTSVFILSRMAILSYVDAMSYHIQVRYLIVLYPALMVLLGLALPSANDIIRIWRRRHGGA